MVLVVFQIYPVCNFVCTVSSERVKLDSISVSFVPISFPQIVMFSDMTRKLFLV